MILRINYVIEGREGELKTVQVKNRRIKTREDVRKYEKKIEKQFGYDKVHIINWKLIWSMGDSVYGRDRNS